MCYLFDVLPTLGKLCGVAAPDGQRRHGPQRRARDPAKTGRPQLLFAYKNVQRAVRDDRWKLIRYPQVDKTQLFDLQADPHETINLADKPESAGQVKVFMALLKKEMEASGDTAPLEVANPMPAEWTPAAPARKPARKTIAPRKER